MIDEELLGRVCMESAIIADLKQRHEITREAVRKELRVGTRLPSDLGTVSMKNGRSGHRIVDEAAFLAWVEANAPDQIMVTVSPAFRAAVTRQGGLKIDGELHPVDGVEAYQGDPTLEVVLSDRAKFTAEYLLGGMLDNPPLVGEEWPEIEGAS